MPELPEVETIAANLRSGRNGGTSLIGEKIQKAEVLWPRTLAVPVLEGLNARVSGQTIHTIGRRGKYLIFQLSSDFLLIHLRMSGDLLVEPSEAPLPSHTRMFLNFTNGWRLAFIDPRKFGRVWLLADPAQVTGGLGPDPFDASLSIEDFHDLLQSRHRQLKPLLLDQSFLAGLGNIYTDESLHRAGLHPNMQSNELSFAQAATLLDSIRMTLAEGIQRQGASIDWVYRGGDFQNYFRVYRRTGQPCPVCGTPIARMVVGQRGTHYCPVCQALEPH
jgi:formamidopyrimidine-DNA glycosylase